MSSSFLLVKAALRLLAENKRKSFIKACKNPREAQEELKKKLIHTSTISFPEVPVEYTFYDSKITTKNAIRFYETTSGSTGAKKRIPYTRELLKSFENMFLLWAHDLVFHSGLNLKDGKFFMSVSPRIGESSTDDRKYLSPFLNLLLSPFLVSNPDTHKASDGDEFLRKIANDLRKARELEIISIWSPTYLLSVLNELKNDDLKALWPSLKLISCWTEAQAEKPANKLREMFPHVRVQPKGLLMTEAPVTIPWSEAGGNIPLINETLIELYDGQTLIPVYDGVVGKDYTIIISQQNGFLRYNTHDRVRIEKYFHKVPVMKFLGREGQSSDLAGEKFSESLMQEVFKDIKETFFVLPETRDSIPGYTIVSSKVIKENWEERLKSIHHYDLARKLRQLHPAQLIEVDNPSEVYLKFCQSEGMNLGDIKEKILISDLMQAERFLAWIEKESPSSLQDQEA